jgi:integrase
MAAKDQPTYWKTKIIKRKIRGADSNHYYARIQAHGKRAFINLQTSNAQSAAREAARVYSLVARDGWVALKPKKNDADDMTIGEYFKAVREHTTIKEDTLNTYIRMFRGMVAWIQGLAEDKSRFAAKNVDAWIQKVDNVKLSKITDRQIERWHVAYLKKRESLGPIKYEKGKSSAGSILRNSKNLFREKVLKALPFELNPAPFADIQPPAQLRNRFSPQATLSNLMEAAKTELSGDTYIVFLISLGAGLRRGEIDRLRWTDIDEDAGTIRVATTEDGSTKSMDSQRTVFIGQFLSDKLREHRTNQGFYVIAPTTKMPSRTRKSKIYRCESIFKELILWLRGQGITAHKPIHHLRGIFGDELAKSFGIYAASSQLGHSDIGTTRSYYAAGESQTPLEL